MCVCVCVCVRRLDNLIYSSNVKEVVAVLDWELSTLGDPVSDLAYVCMPYHMDPDQPQLKGEGETVLLSLSLTLFLFVSLFKKSELCVAHLVCLQV